MGHCRPCHCRRTRRTDAGIAAWETKRFYDYVRPLTAVTSLFAGQEIECWGGPHQGTVLMDGADWIPYQMAHFPTPPFAEYVSGHSAFSAAGAEILRLWTGKDKFGGSVTFAAGSSVTEPGLVPAAPVTLSWSTFSEAADEAGASRLYGGIHFRTGDIEGRKMGRAVAQQAWSRALTYFGNPRGRN